MELRTYIEILWRRKWVIAATTVTTLVVVVVGTLLATPVYEASTTHSTRRSLAAGHGFVPSRPAPGRYTEGMGASVAGSWMP